ncbi:MAG: NADH:ubiquinone oxidoreductase subunit NDUFA12 [Pseudomonadota bacterium]
MTVLSLLKTIFTWWNSATVGTRLFTWQQGHRVGEDEQGNVYYESRKPGPMGRPRRWVIYNGTVEASRIPPDWHGWLHHTYDTPPTEAPLRRQSWEKDHKPNLTGTRQAYRPPGSLWKGADRPKTAGDYKPWRPE